jgi:hypothetical protein
MVHLHSASKRQATTISETLEPLMRLRPLPASASGASTKFTAFSLIIKPHRDDI